MSTEIIENTSAEELSAEVICMLRCNRCQQDLISSGSAAALARDALALGWRKVKASFSNTSSLVEKLYCAACVAYIRKQQATAQANA